MYLSKEAIVSAVGDPGKTVDVQRNIFWQCDVRKTEHLEECAI